jgi:hypothetical protein
MKVSIPLVVLAATLVMAGSGCKSSAQKPQADPQRRLLLIGVDGAAWDAMIPMIRRGELPHMESLVRSGYSARLTTMAPALSPVVWTSIATGKRPAQHGIRGFLGRDPESGDGVPVTSNMRRTAPVWSMLGASGVPVSVVGWWVTWPAEQVNGSMVSPYAAPGQTTWKGSVYADGREGQTWPPELLARIAPTIEAGVATARAGFQDLFPPLPQGDTPDYLQAFLKDMLWVHVSDTIFRDVGVQLLGEDQPGFATVYFGGVDVTGHRFWRFSHPEDQEWEVQADQIEAYGEALGRYYRWTDDAIGRLLAVMPPETTVLIVSDHGMELARHRSKPASDWNQYPHEISGGHIRGPDGILIFSGPGAAANFDPEWWDGGAGLPRLGAPGHPGVLDVTPSLLHFFALPVGADMTGEVQMPLFSKEIAGREVLTMPTWDDPDLLPDPTPMSSPRMDEVKERLRGLGYID